MTETAILRNIRGTPEYEHRRAWDREYAVRRRAARSPEQKQADSEKDNLRAARKRAANPDLVQEQMLRANLKRKYGITLEQHAEMVAAQSGKCAICKQPTENLHVDHDHATGQIRGMLCKFCNRGLGMFRDNKQALAEAIRYLGVE